MVSNTNAWEPNLRRFAAGPRSGSSWTQNKRSLKLRRLSGLFYRARTGPGYP